MIEIMEIKTNTEEVGKTLSDDKERRFIFLDGGIRRGAIHFITWLPEMMFLNKVEVNHENSPESEIIVDGLFRAACNKFQKENIIWIIAEKEMIHMHNLLSVFFTPLSQRSELMNKEALKDTLVPDTAYYVMKTEMIYKECCKGV